MANPKSRSELLKFLDYVGEKGLLSPSTAESRKASVNKVLSILDDAEAQDVSKLDLDDVALRFANLHGQNYTTDSLRTYKSRTKSSIDDFLRYVENPLAFKVGGAKRTPRAKAEKPLGGSEPKDAGRKEAQTAERAEPPSAATGIIPIPIRADLIVRIQGVPFDLTASEAKKVANVILAMAVPD